MPRRLALILSLLLMLLAACGQEDITADKIVSGLQQTLQNTTDLHTVVDLSFTSVQQSGSASVEIWSKRGADPANLQGSKLRVKVLDASEQKFKGAELVSDGSTGWAYVPAENKVYTGKIEELRQLHGDEGEQVPTDPLAAAAQLRDIVDQGLAAFDVELLGEEQVANIDAYKVKLSPKAETQQKLQLQQMIALTLWVDQDRFLPLKLTADAGFLGKAEIAARSLETNSGLADDVFAFAPPAGAEVINIVDMIKEAQPRSVTLEQARQQAGFPLLDAQGNLPGEARLVEVKIVGTQEQGSLIIQQYSGKGVEFSLVQTQGLDGKDLDEWRGGADRRSASSEVTVRGVQGQLVEGKGRRAMTMLSWEENGVHVSIAGKLSAEEALSIAEGLK